MCLSVAYLIDVYRGEAALSHPLTAMLYVVQFPVLAAGPIVRYRDFSRFHRRSDRDVTLADVTYGVRRLVIGLRKGDVCGDSPRRSRGRHFWHCRQPG